MTAKRAWSVPGGVTLAELERREGLSGLEEFALRKVRQREGEAP